MQDRFGRTISYLRVSVTDRCNLRCRYCMPESGVTLLGHDEVLSFEEIVEVVKAAAQMGITKVRLTGGEPLVRKGIVDLVSMISAIEGISDLGLTTNGILLADFAQELADGGLGRINVSVDSMIPHRYKEMTRGGDIEDVIRQYHASSYAGRGLRTGALEALPHEEPFPLQAFAHPKIYQRTDTAEFFHHWKAEADYNFRNRRPIRLQLPKNFRWQNPSSG